MGRKQINHEQTPARFAEGTLARIDEKLALGESRSAFIKHAVEQELERRERGQGQDRREKGPHAGN